MLSKYLKWAIYAGIFGIVLVTPFYVAENMFFPYITGKGFFFRIAVEIIFALWLILAMVDKNYRPKFSPVLWSATAIIAVLVLSTIFSVNPSRSFWSNYERMEGLISHLHLFAYFLVLTGVFKKDVEWRGFLYTIAVSGVSMAVYGYLQAFGLVQISTQSGARVDGTFGNAGYMAIFIVFNVFIAGYLFLIEKKKWLKSVLAVAALFEIPTIFLTATRGAVLGLLGGIFLLALMFVFLSTDKRLRVSSIVTIASALIFITIFLFLRDANFIRKNSILSRFSNLSFSERTVQSRFIIWGMFFEGFKEKPVLGWGIENAGLVFNKYYKPELWQQEPWFDRAHNIVFDWLISSGIMGLVTYLSLVVSAIYVLWKKYASEKKYENLIAAGILTSLFGAYFFHNFFVFDNLTSYILFFSVLAFINFFGQNRVLANGKNPVLTMGPVQSFFTATIVFALIFSVYFFNVKPLLANTWLLQALKDASSQGQDVDLVLSDFEKALSYRTFGTGEIREQLSSYANLVATSNLSQELKNKVSPMSVKELENQVKKNPEDARGYLFLSSMYSNAGRHQDGLRAVERALELSPDKQQILFLLADSYLSVGNIEKAYQAVKKSYELDKTHFQAAKNLAAVAIIAGRVQEAENVLIGHFGSVIVPDQILINAYARVGNFGRVRDIWLALIANEPQNAQYHVNLAATYLELGERSKSIQELEKAIVLNPAFKAQGEALINEIKAGRNPITK